MTTMSPSYSCLRAVRGTARSMMPAGGAAQEIISALPLWHTNVETAPILMMSSPPDTVSMTQMSSEEKLSSEVRHRSLLTSVSMTALSKPAR